MLHQSTRHAAAAEHANGLLVSFRHVSHVRIDHARGHAVVVGIRYRLPVDVVVPVEVGEELRRLGVRAVRSGVAS